MCPVAPRPLRALDERPGNAPSHVAYRIPVRPALFVHFVSRDPARLRPALRPQPALSLRLSRQLHLSGRSFDLRSDTDHRCADPLNPEAETEGPPVRAGGLFFDRRRVLAAEAKQGAYAWPSSRF